MSKELPLLADLAISSFFSRAENPRDALSDIAASRRFAYVMWHHGMHTTKQYTREEMKQIASWLKQFGLRVRDVHGTDGEGVVWSTDEDTRVRGVELFKNRVALAKRIGAEVVIMHVPREPRELEKRESYWSALRRTLDALQPYTNECRVRVALENLWGNEGDDFTTISRLVAQYASDFLGVCYDPGHGNLCGNGLERLDTVKERLIAVHLNDNLGDGRKTASGEDRHMLLYTGTVCWPTVAKAIARSSYDGPMSMEVGKRNHAGMSISEFLETAYETGVRFVGEVEVFRKQFPRT